MFIQHDQTRKQRLLAGNFRTVINEINGGTSNVSFRGMRVVRMLMIILAPRKDRPEILAILQPMTRILEETYHTSIRLRAFYGLK